MFCGIMRFTEPQSEEGGSRARLLIDRCMDFLPFIWEAASMIGGY